MKINNREVVDFFEFDDKVYYLECRFDFEYLTSIELFQLSYKFLIEIGSGLVNINQYTDKEILMILNKLNIDDKNKNGIFISGLDLVHDEIYFNNINNSINYKYVNLMEIIKVKMVILFKDKIKNKNIILNIPSFQKFDINFKIIQELKNKYIIDTEKFILNKKLEESLQVKEKKEKRSKI